MLEPADEIMLAKAYADTFRGHACCGDMAYRYIRCMEHLKNAVATMVERGLDRNLCDFDIGVIDVTRTESEQ